MRSARFLWILSLGALLILQQCKKNDEVCNSAHVKPFGFNMYEQIMDTVLATDTSYIHRLVVFKSNEEYSDVQWTIGGDPRTFSSNRVEMVFNSPENITGKLTANSLNSFCQQEQKELSLNYTLLAEGPRNRSPLIGSYRGFNTDNPSDIFTVEVKYWYGPKYTWWSSGAYTVDNLPKGYQDSTREINGVKIPEIRGIIAATGYKNFAFDKSGNLPALGIKAYGSLRGVGNDTLLINYSILDTLKFNQSGIVSYLQKQFKGLKQPVGGVN